MTTNGATAQPGERTLIALVVDRSGSMASCRDDMQGGINTFLNDQRKVPGKCRVTLAQFDTEHEVIHDNTKLGDVGSYTLEPGGGTALLDAMGRTMTKVEAAIKATPKDKRPKHVIFVVVTDGYENSSIEWTRSWVADEVKRLTEAGWHFSFLGANMDAVAEGHKVGVAAATSMTFTPDSAGIGATYAGLSHNVMAVRCATADSLAYSSAQRAAAMGEDEDDTTAKPTTPPRARSRPTVKR